MHQTALQIFVSSHDWVWAVCQIIHFVGMSLIVGIVGTLDLRILGLFKSIPIAAFRPLVPWAVVGFVCNLLTGIIFVTGKDSGTQLLHRQSVVSAQDAVRPAGSRQSDHLPASGLERRVYATPAGGNAPAAAKAVSAFSLVAWLLVIFFGRIHAVQRHAVTVPGFVTHVRFSRPPPPILRSRAA